MHARRLPRSLRRWIPALLGAFGREALIVIPHFAAASLDAAAPNLAFEAL
jgi:hypothetical protein